MNLPRKKMNIVFWISFAVLTSVVLAGVLFPESFENGADAVYGFISDTFGWLFLIAMFVFVVVLGYLAISKYGKMKLGGPDEKPAFPLFTWIAMLFSAGFGIALVFYGVGEPMSHFYTPPIKGVEPLSEEAARVSMAYSFFHYGVSQWSVFAIVGLCMAYFQFRKKKNGLVATAIEPILGKSKKTKPIKNTINILAVVATIVGIATSLGMGIAQMNGGLNTVFGVPNGIPTQLIIIGIMTALFLFSSTTGLNKGIKWLSNINMVIAIGLMLFVFIAGPTVFILETFTLAIGDYLSNFINYSLRLTPYSGGTWVKDWTVFYWAWVIAWSPFVGAFIARISKGRTIREFVLGVLIAPAVIGMMWMAVFGGTALHLDLFEGTNIAGAVNNDITSALFTTFAELPLSNILSVVAMLLIITFLVTSADSAVFILSSMTSGGKLNPPIKMRIVWGILLSSIATVLLINSGLQGLQTASLVAALPFTFIVFLMIISLFKSIRGETDPLPYGESMEKSVKSKNKQKNVKAGIAQKSLQPVNIKENTN